MVDVPEDETRMISMIEVSPKQAHKWLNRQDGRGSSAYQIYQDWMEAPPARGAIQFKEASSHIGWWEMSTDHMIRLNMEKFYGSKCIHEIKEVWN